MHTILPGMGSQLIRHFYYNEGWQCLEERRQSGSAVSDYADRRNVWGIRYVDDLILRHRDSNLDNTLNETLYALQDANYNVVALAQPNGTIAQRFIYNAYGKVTELHANFTPYSGSGFAWEYLYTGRRLDRESGLMYYRNRYYHVGLGRFVTRDPIGYDGSRWNLYEYVGGRPLEAGDPDGLRWGIINDFFTDLIFPTPGPGPATCKNGVSILASGPEFHQAGGNIVIVSSLGDLINQVNGKVNGNNCLHSLEINGHGNPHGINIGDGSTDFCRSFDRGDDVDSATAIGSPNQDSAAAALARLPWCCPCTLRVTGCNTGNLKGTSTWPQRLADATGCNVVAPGGYSWGTTYKGNSVIRKGYYEKLPWQVEPGFLERCANRWYGNPDPRWRTYRETEKYHASEDDKVYTFTPKNPPNCQGKDNSLCK